MTSQMIDQHSYEWTTKVNENGTLDIFLDGIHVTNIQVYRDFRVDNYFPSEIQLYAQKSRQEVIDGKKRTIRTYGHGAH